MSIRTRRIALFGLVVGLLLGVSTKAPAADVYMTMVETKEIKTLHGKRETDVPTDQKISFAWSDQPFAIHIPFEMETRTVRNIDYTKEYLFRYYLRGFGPVPNRVKKDMFWNLVKTAAGVFRADRQVIDKRSGLKYWSYGRSAVAIVNRSVSGVSGHSASKCSGAVPLGPGPVVFWLTIDPRRLDHVGGTAWTIFGEKTAGTLFYDILVKEKVDDQFEFKSVDSGQFDFEIRQNGWQVRRFDTTITGDWQPRRPKPGGITQYIADIDSSVRRASIISKHRFTRLGGREAVAKGRAVPQEDFDWQLKIDLPSPIYDHASWDYEYEIRCLRSPRPAGDRRGSGDETWGLSLASRPKLFVWEYPIDQAARVKPRALFYADYYVNQYRWTSKPGARLPVATKQTSWPTPIRHTSLKVNPDEFIDPKISVVLPAEWTADREAGPHRLLTLEQEFSPFDVAAKNRPKKRINIYAMRLSELTDNRADRVRTVARGPVRSKDDGYYKWKAQNIDDDESRRRRITAILMELSSITNELHGLDAEFMALLGQLYLMPSEEDLFGRGLVPATILNDDVRTFRDGAAGRRYMIGKLQPEVIRKQMKDLRDKEIQPKRDAREPLVREAEQEFQKLIDSAVAQDKRSAGRRPDVKETIKELKKDQLILEMKLYEEAGRLTTQEVRERLRELTKHDGRVGAHARTALAMWFWESARLDDRKVYKARLDEMLRAGGEQGSHESTLSNLAAFVGLIDPADPRTKPSDDRYVKAVRANRHEAVVQLRKIVAADPNDYYARLSLCKIESWYMNQFARKLDREKKVTLEGFYMYLKTRDISPDDISSDVWEQVRYNWGAGWLNHLFNYIDEPGAMADEAIAVQESTAMHLVSIQLIRRLLNLGIPLRGIVALKHEDLDQNLRFGTIHGKRIPLGRAHRLVKDMHQTLDLPDVKLFVEAKTIADMQAFEKQFKFDYYAVIDPDQGYVELLFELTSPKNMIMFYAGKHFPIFLGNSSIAQKFAHRVIGAKGLAYLGGAALSYTESRLLTKLLVTLTGYVVAHRLAEESGIPHATDIVNVLFFINAHEAAANLIVQSGVRYGVLQAAVNQVASQAAEAKVRHEARGRMIDKAGQTLDDVDQSISSGKGITEAQRQELEVLLREIEASIPPSPPKPGGTPLLDRAANPSPSPNTPNPNVPVTVTAPARVVTVTASNTDREMAAYDTLLKALKAMARGDAAEAQRALDMARNLSKLVKGDLTDLNKRIEGAQNALKVAFKNPPSAKPAPLDRAIRVITDPGKFLDEAAYAVPRSGRHMRMGDFMLTKYEYDHAIASYRKAADQARKNYQFAQAELAESKIILIETARRARLTEVNAAAEAVRFATDTPISPKAVKDVGTLLDSGKTFTSLNQGEDIGSKWALLVEDTQGAKYVLKMEWIPGDREAEHLAAGLAKPLRRFGLDVPETHLVSYGRRTVKITYKDTKSGSIVTKDQEISGYGVLIRHVPNADKTLRDLTEAEILGRRRAYAVQRLLRAVMGDPDGHGGNVIPAADFRLRAIDFGMGRVRKAAGEPIKQYSHIKPGSEAEFMDNCLNLPSHPHFHQPKLEGMYKWINRLDEMLDYDTDFKLAVDELKRVRKDPGPNGLKSIIENRCREADGTLDKVLVDEVFKVYSERIDNLEAVLRKRLRQHVPPTSPTDPYRDEILKGAFVQPEPVRSLNRRFHYGLAAAA